MINWLRKTWVLFAVVIAAQLIYGPLQAWILSHLGGGFAQTALVIDKLSALCLVLIVCNFIIDTRERWGIFPSLDVDAAIDTAIRGTFEEDPQDPARPVRKPNPIACALVFLGVAAMLIAILFLAVPRAGAATIDDARPYLPVLSKSIDSNWPAAPLRHVPAGQIEQESSWKHQATMHTSRELGRGLVQMTIAYDKSGKERFNIYREAVRYPQLRAWDWQRQPYSVPHQMAFLVLQDRSNFRQVRGYCNSDTEAWRCALVCYNAGEGRWLSRLRNARLKGLPADRWEGGLDQAYGKGESAVLYGRPLWQAVNEYPRVIMRRAEKYRGRV